MNFHLPVILLLLFFAAGISSCKKEPENTLIFSEAKYSIELTGYWTSPGFAVPDGAHFTNIAGMVHKPNNFLWQPGQPASRGVENVAETGNTNVILYEIDSLISQDKALAVIYHVPPAPAGMRKFNFYCNSNYSAVSFVSMIAPSPDWFIGVNNLNLYRNNQWIKDTTVNLYVFDSGTEDGDVFGYNNPPTIPQQPIYLLSLSQASVLANGNSTLGFLVTARFTRL